MTTVALTYDEIAQRLDLTIASARRLMVFAALNAVGVRLPEMVRPIRKHRRVTT
jgi:hypothetical protein